MFCRRGAELVCERSVRLEAWKLGANQVDLWHIDVSGLPEVGGCRRLLSSDEIERANRFHFEKHQRCFTLMRAAMREILGGYAGIPPQDLVFSYGDKGKPELAGQAASAGITFNLSHSDQLGLLGVTQGLVIGVDIELVNPEFGGQEIAERFFSASEVRHLLSIPAQERADAFFSCWTRKEAYIKALGDGLSVPLDSFEVAFGPGRKAALLAVRVDPGEVTRWSMYDIDATPGYKAALVVEGSQHRLRYLRWTQQTNAGRPLEQ
jgi:4'-phosphopantetheinyl transferase